jgi:hypothetical protein
MIEPDTYQAVTEQLDTVIVTETEKRFLERIRRLRREQCRGVLVQFEGVKGFVLYRLSDKKEA